MIYSKRSFIIPKITETEGMLAVAPRQKIQPGHLVYISYQRQSDNPRVQFPRRYGGTHCFAHVLNEHEQDDSLLHVRILGVYGTQSSGGLFVGQPGVIPKRACAIIHPDPEFYFTRDAAGRPHVSKPVILPPKFITGFGAVPMAFGNSLGVVYNTINRRVKDKARARLQDRILNWLPMKTSRELMIERAMQSSIGEDRRDAEALRKLTTWFRGREMRGKNFAGFIKTFRQQGAPALAPMSQWLSGLTGLTTTTRGSMMRRIQSLGESVNATYSPACRHWHEGASIRVGIVGLTHNAEWCPDCVQSRIDSGVFVNIMYTDDNGDDRTGLIDANQTVYYTWSDGWFHLTQEPQVIGSYHSSKSQLMKKLPHLDGKTRAGLSLGFELEFVREDHCDKSPEWFAKQMLDRIEKSTKTLLGKQKYACFEYDGSVEFELVSGYGPIELHRRVIRDLFDDGYFAKWLRSHDGGRCGLHVHLDKPEYSLLHGVKLTQFYNARENEALLRCVARRLSAGARYSKQIPDKMKNKGAASRLLKNAKYNNMGNTRKKILRAAMFGLSSDRYELVNWQNEKTAEVRAFRGSMRASTIIACLEFAYLSWFFTRDTPAHQLTTPKFLDYISLQVNRNNSAYLRRYLSDKGFQVWVAKADPRMNAIPLVDLSEGALAMEV